MTQTPIVLIGNPENRRVRYFCEAAHALGFSRPTVVSYIDMLKGNRRLTDLLTPDTLLRIESPGENFQVEKELIALGAMQEIDSQHPRISAQAARALDYDHGRIRFLKQWYLGFAFVLQQWQMEWQTIGCRIFNTPAAIRTLFDKRVCQQYLQAAYIPVPIVLPVLPDYETLRHYLEQRAGNRLFIKPLHSSSASGVMAYRLQGNLEKLTTSIERVQEGSTIKLYNSLRIHTYTRREEIRQLVDTILQEGALVEEWIPKATLHGHFFDLRIVVINGKATFVLPRLSKYPITNLHLGNKRGAAADVQHLLGEEAYAYVCQLAERAVQQIPGISYAGVDVLIPAGLGNARVLEINAFGDLMPGLLHNGYTTYQTELHAHSYGTETIARHTGSVF